jgi:hypothetical protein
MGVIVVEIDDALVHERFLGFLGGPKLTRLDGASSARAIDHGKVLRARHRITKPEDAYRSFPLPESA